MRAAETPVQTHPSSRTPQLHLTPVHRARRLEPDYGQYRGWTSRVSSGVTAGERAGLPRPGRPQPSIPTAVTPRGGRVPSAIGNRTPPGLRQGGVTVESNTRRSLPG